MLCYFAIFSFLSRWGSCSRALARSVRYCSRPSNVLLYGAQLYAVCRCMRAKCIAVSRYSAARTMLLRRIVCPVAVRGRHRLTLSAATTLQLNML